MSETEPPTLDEIHRLAVRNFERFIRIVRIAGVVLLIVAIALFAAHRAIPLNLSTWYGTIPTLSMALGVQCLVQTYLLTRRFPVYRTAINAADDREYGTFLYFYGRPSSERRQDAIRVSAVFVIPIVVSYILWFIAEQLWPEQHDTIMGIVLAAILIFFALGVRKQRRADAWYAAHFAAQQQ